ncbi:MAG: hypothetical protein A2017_00765 [Lentisphaerae bacterium GWF2_44_16]|nr:MAG: hypothetical protein A2017_00765 [Lentisphaerae bacterium GWF2_44_16]
MKKTGIVFLLLCAIFAIAFSTFALSNSEKLEELRAGRKKLLAEIYKLRVKLIQEDPDIKALHKKIMALHRELAVKIDNKEEMKELLRKNKMIDAEINKLAEGKDNKQ